MIQVIDDEDEGAGNMTLGRHRQSNVLISLIIMYCGWNV